MKPLIGITPQWDKVNAHLWLWESYVDFVIAAGAIPVVLPCEVSEECIVRYANLIDGLLLTGGADVEPAAYGSTRTELCDTVPLRDRFEFCLLRKTRALGKPIFGICRAAQLINVAYGGTLIEDIPTLVNPRTEHRTFDRRYPNMHDVDVTQDSFIAKVCGCTHFEVNSFHHQAIGHLGKGLKITGRSSSDGIVEAIEATDGPFLAAVQWHPERIYQTHPQSLLMLRHFVSLCTKS